jgi:type III secretion protein J
MSRWQRRAILTLAACLLAACSRTDVYSNLDEREANEMIATLSRAGIAGEKVSQDGKTWHLQTKKSDFDRSVAVLKSQGYPRDHFTDLGEVFKKQGLVSTPLEEHARLLHALSQEMSNTVSEVDGVVWARVHISLPQSDPLLGARAEPSASVFVKYDPEVDLRPQIGAIKSLVANGVEGLTYDRVTVILSPAQPAPPVQRPRSAATPFGWIATLAGAVAAMAAVAITLLNRRWPSRPTMST